jgi:hypothetical protein
LRILIFQPRKTPKTRNQEKTKKQETARAGGTGETTEAEKVYTFFVREPAWKVNEG